MRSCIFLLVYLVSFLSVNAVAKLIPSYDQYKDFLVGQYQANRPSVVVFKDPFCPYCLKAIPKLELLNHYNVYLFWSPILGSRSISRVQDIFKCEQPVNKQVLNAIATRRSPECNKPLNQKFWDLNHAIIENYSINSVPAYYLQGTRVSMTRLINANSQHLPVNGVVLNWQRFELMKNRTRALAKTTAIIIPQGGGDQIQAMVKKMAPEYLFLHQALIKKNPQLINCGRKMETCTDKTIATYVNRVKELELMLGLVTTEDKIYVIKNDGTLAVLTL